MIEAQTALEAALAGGADLGIEHDERFVERVFLFHRLSPETNLAVVDGAVFDEGVEACQIGASDGAPQHAPDFGMDLGGDDVDEAFGLTVLLPKSNEQNERLGNVVLAEGITEANRGAIFGGLGVHGDAAVPEIGGGGNVPFLRVAFRLVAVEESIANPFFKYDAVLLHLGGRQAEVKPKAAAERQREAEDSEEVRAGGRDWI